MSGVLPSTPTAGIFLGKRSQIPADGGGKVKRVIHHEAKEFPGQVLEN